jgi:hypothetical protein
LAAASTAGAGAAFAAAGAVTAAKAATGLDTAEHAKTSSVSHFQAPSEAHTTHNHEQVSTLNSPFIMTFAS